jgi:hypothetical protein
MTTPETQASPPEYGGKTCSTHHHACDCREARLYAVLRGVADDLSKSADAAALQACVDINEMWIELYGLEILPDARIHRTSESRHNEKG